MSQGRFITFEGIDGAGKSTHLDWFGAQLRQRGHEVVVTREPGGTPVGEKLREILLSEPMHVETEVLLMFAARQEHLALVIRPVLSSGRWVLCDRFTDATYAYQGGGRGMSWERIAELERRVQEGLQPDLTLVFDLPARIARERLVKGQPRPDRFEREDEAFFQRVRDTYLCRARSDPGRIRVIDSARPVPEVKKTLENIIVEISSK